MKIDSPNELIENAKSHISKSDIYAFISSLFMGIITHMYYITNQFPNADTNLAPNLCGDLTAWMISLGRWCAGFFDKISSNFMLPWITGIISIFLLSCVSVIIVRMYVTVQNPS